MAQRNILDNSGGAAKRERYIFPVAAGRIGPTNPTEISQAGVEPGYPKPDTDNVSDDGVWLGVDGRMRQDAAEDASVKIRFEDSVGVPGPRYTIRDVEAGRISVDQLIAQGAAEKRRKVRRYSIMRTGSDLFDDDPGQIGISPAWTLVEEIDARPPGIAAATMEFAPDFTLDRWGNRLIAWTATESGTGKTYAVVYRYAPHKAVTSEHLLTIDLWAESGTPGLESFDVEWAVLDGDTYLLVSVGTKVAQVYLIRGTNGAFGDCYATLISSSFVTDFQFTRLAATNTTAGVLIAAQQIGTKGIRFGLTQDLRTWSTISGDAATVAFSEFRQVYSRVRAAGSSGPSGISDVFAVGETAIWATTLAGEILSSTDGGKNWDNREAPTDGIRNASLQQVPLHSIAAYGTTLLAVGDDGCVLRSTNSGASWTVIRYTAGAAADVFEAGQFDASGVATKDITSQTLRKVKMISATRAWIVGGGFVYYTSDGGDSWSTIQNVDGGGTYTDFVVDDAASGNVMLVVGTSGVHNDRDLDKDAIPDTDFTDHVKLAALITNADNAGTAAVSYLLGPDEAGDRSASANAITIERNGDHPAPNDAAAIGYVLLNTGRVLRFEGDGTTVAFTPIADLPEGDLYLDLHSPDQDTGGASGELVVVGLRGQNVPGYVYQTTDAHTGDASGTPSTFVQQVIGESPTALWMFDLDTGVIGTTKSLWRATEALNHRLEPDLLTLEEGAVIYVVRNATKGWIEVYRAERPAPGVFPNFKLTTRIALPKSGDETLGYAPRLCEALDGTIVLAIGLTHWASPDGGFTWVRAASDWRLPVPINNHGTTSEYVDAWTHAGSETNNSLASNRTLIEYNGGILYSAVPNADGDTIGIFACWDWATDGAYYRPVVDGKGNSLGIDGLVMIVNGEPAARDVWEIQPRYLHAVENVATDSPSAAVWRSKTDDVPNTLTWDAQDAAVTDVLGARELWAATFFGLFGTQFSQCTFAVSDPNNPGSFTELAVTSLLDSGAATGPAGKLTSNILKCSGKAWTPGQWAPGPQRFFLRMTNQGLSYRIVANGEDWIEVDGSVDLDGSASHRAFYIYADRLCWDGEGGTGPGSAGLLGSDYQFMQLIHMAIPAQPTPDGFFEVGRAFIGQEVGPDDDGYSFLYGSTFRHITNTEQDVSKGGHKVVRHYGRTGRLWEWEYNHQSPDAVGRKLNSLLAKMREPFVLIQNGDDLSTAVLVRLVDAVEMTALTGNRYRTKYLLEEVV